jgi:hypothetical protein
VAAVTPSMYLYGGDCSLLGSLATAGGFSQFAFYFYPGTTPFPYHYIMKPTDVTVTTQVSPDCRSQPPGANSTLLLDRRKHVRTCFWQRRQAANCSSEVKAVPLLIAGCTCAPDVAAQSLLGVTCCSMHVWWSACLSHAAQ